MELALSASTNKDTNETVGSLKTAQDHLDADTIAQVSIAVNVIRPLAGSVLGQRGTERKKLSQSIKRGNGWLGGLSSLIF